MQSKEHFEHVRKVTCTFLTHQRNPSNQYTNVRVSHAEDTQPILLPVAREVSQQVVRDIEGQ